jgi:hypothetical protein
VMLGPNESRFSSRMEEQDEATFGDVMRLASFAFRYVALETSYDKENDLCRRQHRTSG